MVYDNFNTSSTRTDISMSVCRDGGLAEIYFDDFKNESHQVRINYGHDPFVYLVGDFNRKMWTKSQLKKMTKQELYDLAWEISDCYCDIDNFTKQELIEDYLEYVTVAQYYDKMVGSSWSDFDKHNKFSYYKTVGYCQGDVRLIVDVDKAIDVEFSDGMKKYYDNIFWDCPYDFNIDVDGKEVLSYSDI